MKLRLIIPTLLLAACSTTRYPDPTTPYRPVEEPSHYLPAVKPEPLMGRLKGWDGPTVMDDQEVIQASKQCMYAKLRPNVEYTSVKLDTGGKVLLPIRVHCEPI
jgi:hypothetical protein